MADEELSSAQKLAIGANFVLNSPPAQVNVVMEGVPALYFSPNASRTKAIPLSEERCRR